MTAIANGAFAPKNTGGVPDLNTDITTILNTLVLPSTIKSLGTNLFTGVTEPVKVVIPPVVVAAAAANAGKSEVAAMQDVIGTPHAAVEVYKTEEAAAIIMPTRTVFISTRLSKRR